KAALLEGPDKIRQRLRLQPLAIPLFESPANDFRRRRAIELARDEMFRFLETEEITADRVLDYEGGISIRAQLAENQITPQLRVSASRQVARFGEAIGRLRRPPRKRRGVQTVGLDSRCHLCGHVSRSRSHCCDCRPSRCPNRSLSPNHCLSLSLSLSLSRWPNRRHRTEEASHHHWAVWSTLES